MPTGRRQAKLGTIFSPEKMNQFVQQSMTWGWLFRLNTLIEKYGYSLIASVDRINRHYSHSRTVRADVTLVGAGEDPDTGEPVPEAIDTEAENLADTFENMLGEFVVDFSNNLYRRLEKEYEYQFWGEGAEESIRANEYEFDEDGNRSDGGGYTYDQLEASAKERAKQWWAEGSGDDNWWYETTLDEAKEGLSKIGFSDPDISFSGFGSQGDGASFTSKYLDVDDFTQAAVTGKKDLLVQNGYLE